MIKNGVNNRVPDISKYFNRNTIIENPSRRQIAQLIPGVLTALGILGTFMGLQDGVSKLTIEDPEMIQSSIANLTDGMSLAFITSIIGIVTSLVWSYMDRKQYKNYIKILAIFKEAFEESFEVFSMEHFIGEIFTLEKESTTAIKHMATDISLEFAKALNKSVNEDIIPNMTKSMDKIVGDSLIPMVSIMNDSFKDFTNKTSENQMEALDDIIDSFNKEFNSLAKGEFNELKSTLQSFIHWHKEVKKELSDLIIEIKSVASNHKELNNISDIAINKYGDLLGQINNTNKEMGERLNSIIETIEVLKNISVFNAETVEELNELNKEAKSVHEESKEVYKNMENGLLVLRNNIEDVGENLMTISIGLEQSTVDFSENLKNGLNTTFTIFDENLSEISKRLSGTIVEINQTVEEMPNMILSLYNEMQNHVVKLSEAVEMTTEVYNQIKDIYIVNTGEVI